MLNSDQNNKQLTSNQNQSEQILLQIALLKNYIHIMGERKAVEIYLRVRGPPNPLLQPNFKIQGTKIRFTSNDYNQEQDIMAEFSQRGVYKFDKIYQQTTQQPEIFDDIAKDIVDSSLEGYNGTIFAYGQTGSGKTYTMTGGYGQPEQMGLVPRLISYLFKELEVREQSARLKLRFLQIYNKHGYDLLDQKAKPSKELADLKEVHAYPRGQGFDFHGLSEHEVTNQYDAIQKFQVGDTNRIVRKTPSNDQSSRSHSIFMVQVNTRNNQTGIQQKAVINLVDLAGSERIHNSGINDEKIEKEGININLGLHMLGRVVQALGDQRHGKVSHIPYRDSLLTMALKSSMGGNCKTRMIATLNPQIKSTPESISTCKFAMQLTNMQNTLKKNQFIDPWIIIRALKKETADLRAELQLVQGKQVKEVLDITDVKRVRAMVNQFIHTSDKNYQFPINDRLEIKESLYYMRTMILNLKKGGGPMMMLKSDPEDSSISENHVKQIKHLKNLIQQRDNEINLLLNVINEKREDMSDEFDGPCIKVEEIQQKNIAESIVKSLLNNNKKHYNITTEQVEKHLTRHFSLEKEEDLDSAFERFKDSHIQKEAIDSKDGMIHIKERKREQLLKKIQQIKHERANLNMNIMKQQQNNLKSILPKNTSNIELMKQQLEEIDTIIRKKYKEVKNLELEINRFELGKNKNKEKLKNQFDQFVHDHSDDDKDGQEAHNEVKLGRQNQDKEVEDRLQDFLEARNKLFNE